MRRHDLTVGDLLAELEEARQAALGAENPQSSAAVAATMGKAKILGLDKQIIDHRSSDGSHGRAISIGADTKPETLEALAKSFGLSDDDYIK